MLGWMSRYEWMKRLLLACRVDEFIEWKMERGYNCSLG